jgi:hypothetical protein
VRMNKAKRIMLVLCIMGFTIVAALSRSFS